MRPLNKESGLTLIEIILVIAVSVGIIITATRYYISTRLNANVESAIAQTKETVQLSYEWLNQQPQANFAGNGPTQTTISNQQLINSNFVTQKQLQCPWPNSNLTVSPDPQDASHLRIAYANIPTSACLNLTHRLENVVYNQQQSSPTACQQHQYYGVF